MPLLCTVRLLRPALDTRHNLCDYCVPVHYDDTLHSGLRIPSCGHRGLACIRRRIHRFGCTKLEREHGPPEPGELVGEAPVGAHKALCSAVACMEHGLQVPPLGAPGDFR